MKVPLFNQEGKEINTLDLPEKVFNVKTDPDLLHQAVLYYERLERRPIAKTKTRAEVRGGGKKPWRQKGTGRARHGSIRSPIWRGGGVVFGPSPEKKYKIKLPKKMRKRALFIVLSQKLKDGEVIFLDKIKVSEPKTKEAAGLLKNLAKIKDDIERKKTIFVFSRKYEDFLRAVRNIKKVSAIGANFLNPYILLKNKYLIMEKEAIKYIK